MKKVFIVYGFIVIFITIFHFILKKIQDDNSFSCPQGSQLFSIYQSQSYHGYVGVLSSAPNPEKSYYFMQTKLNNNNSHSWLCFYYDNDDNEPIDISFFEDEEHFVIKSDSKNWVCQRNRCVCMPSDRHRNVNDCKVYDNQ